MKTKLAVLSFLFLISFISATQIYSGDSATINLDKEYEYYTIVGNQSPVDLTLIKTGLDVVITFDKYSQEDNFEIVFFDKEKEIITEYRSGGGGSSKIIYKNNTINQTKYVEVPKEVIKEITQEKECRECEEDIIKEAQEKKIDKITKIISGILIVLMILLFILYIYFTYKITKMDYNYTDERGLDNE
jgi:hypothetical protein